MSTSPPSTQPRLLAGRSPWSPVPRAGSDGQPQSPCRAPTSRGPASVPSSTSAPASRKDLVETGRLVGSAVPRWQPPGSARHHRAARGCRLPMAVGGVDIVFANAGIQAFKPLLEMTEHWHDQINMQPHRYCEHRARVRSASGTGGGRIIVTSSTQGQHGTKYGTACCHSSASASEVHRTRARTGGARQRRHSRPGRRCAPGTRGRTPSLDAAARGSGAATCRASGHEGAPRQVPPGGSLDRTRGRRAAGRLPCIRPGPRVRRILPLDRRRHARVTA